LTGQVFDCYVTPRLMSGASVAASALMGGENSLTSSNCWYTTAVTAETPVGDVVAGMGQLILQIALLYVVSAVARRLLFLHHALDRRARPARNARGPVPPPPPPVDELLRHARGGRPDEPLTNDASAIEQAFSFALVNVFSSAVLIVWVVYTMLTKSVVYTLVSLLVMPVMVIVTVYFSNQARKAFRRARVEMGSVNADLQEGIAAVREVQAFSREDENIEQFKASNAANRDANIRAVAFTSALNPLLESLGYVSMALVIGVGWGVLLAGDGTLAGATISLGLIITFLQYVQRINQPVAQISVQWTTIQNAIAGGERIFGILDTVPDMQDKPDAIQLPQIQGLVEFENVSAEYNPGEPVLEGVSLRAEPGQTVAPGRDRFGQISSSTSSPASMTSPAARHHRRARVRDVTRRSLRQLIGIGLGYVPVQYDREDNIRLCNPEATDERCSRRPSWPLTTTSSCACRMGTRRCWASVGRASARASAS
jgi:ATP-binding cassette subfamily B protein